MFFFELLRAVCVWYFLQSFTNFLEMFFCFQFLLFFVCFCFGQVEQTVLKTVVFLYSLLHFFAYQCRNPFKYVCVYVCVIISLSFTLCCIHIYIRTNRPENCFSPVVVQRERKRERETFSLLFRGFKIAALRFENGRQLEKLPFFWEKLKGFETEKGFFSLVLLFCLVLFLLFMLTIVAVLRQIRVLFA